MADTCKPAALDRLLEPQMPLKLAAAVTAGGRSSRFGGDKALARLGGRTLLDRAASSFGALPDGPRLLIATPGRYELPGWTVIPDTRPGVGPLAGLEAALGALGSQAPFPAWLAFAAVDLPYLTPAYWELLAERREGEREIVCGLDDAGRPQPLAALYPLSVLEAVTALLDGGERSMRALLAAWPLLTVPWEEVEAVCPHAYHNVNRPEDLPPA